MYRSQIDLAEIGTWKAGERVVKQYCTCNFILYCTIMYYTVQYIIHSTIYM